MVSTGLTEAFVYEAVKSGFLEIRDDGSVWRIAYDKFNRWKGCKERVPCKEPHRVDEGCGEGYRIVKVMRDKKQVTTYAQRLVYHHFHGPIPPGMTVNHDDGNRMRNHPDNLKLATYKEQYAHRRDVLGHGPADIRGALNPMAKLTPAAVAVIRARRSNGETLEAIANGSGVQFQAISKICRGTRWVSQPTTV